MKSPKVIFEDNEIIVLDKPSGWIVNDAVTTGKNPVIQAWLRENFDYPLAGDRQHRSGIVHRLDKETSGILVVAKTLAAFQNLQLQFKDREIEKAYLALAHGKLELKKGEISAPVKRLTWNRERFGVLPGGREAVTSYKVIKFYRLGIANYYTLVELYPKTGRTHQIRIHLKYLGHPIVSDSFYAGRKTARKDRQVFPRLFLHAKGVSLNHPKTGKKLKFESKLPSDLSQPLGSLEKLPQTP